MVLQDRSMELEGEEEKDIKCCRNFIEKNQIPIPLDFKSMMESSVKLHSPRGLPKECIPSPYHRLQKGDFSISTLAF